LVHDSVPDELAGVSLGLATLVFCSGGSLGAAVAGLGAALGWDVGLVLLALVPLAVGLSTRRQLRAST
jgi:hypothetical protein